MTDREKVIRGLEACIEPCCRGNDCPYFYEPDCGVLKKDAIQLLKEQEPKSVLSQRECETLPTHYERKGFCPKCHQVVEWYLNRAYCGFCGQAVKWDAVD